MKSFLFKEALFNQILAGNKTQTRRIMKTGFTNSDLGFIDYSIGWNNALFEHSSGRFAEIKSPKRVGDICYLKEPYKLLDDELFYAFDFSDDKEDRGLWKWKNKLFMPEKYARYFVKITNVRVQQVNDISDEDAIAEGIEQITDSILTDDTYYKIYSKNIKKGVTNLPILSFYSLWQSIHKKEPNRMEDNPWLWVYEFELVTNEGNPIK